MDTNVVVESRLEFEAGEQTCRTAWDRDGRRHGLYFLRHTHGPLHTVLWAAVSATTTTSQGADRPFPDGAGRDRYGRNPDG